MLNPPSLIRSLVSTLLLLGAAAAPATAQDDDDRSLHWSEFTVSAHLDAEGLLHVRERQGMVLEGAWNGGERRFQARAGQELDLQSIERIDPATGERTPLVEGDLDRVDEYAWQEGALRWRSRLESDPPFADDEIVYELTYTIAPVLLTTEEGGYRFAHDFAFADRDGVIERFQVDLTLDSAWTSSVGNHIREAMSPLPPGRGYVVSLPLTRAGDSDPGALVAFSAPPPAPAVARYGVALGALLIPLLAFLGLRGRSRHLERVAPATPPDQIDEEWLTANIFGAPAEEVGTAWDRSVGEAEVAALLARLVAEGKLSSRVEPDDDGDDPVLHLRRLAPLDAFAPHERALLEGLFYDGSDETDTASVKKHYENKGFDPAATIREPLLERLSSLPGEGKVKRTWIPAVLLILIGVGMTIFVPDRPGRAPFVLLGLVVGGMVALIALPFATLLARRITRRTSYTVGILLALGLPALLLALVAAGLIPGQEAVVFYRPGAGLLISLLVLLAGLALCAVALAHPTETAERLAFRRRLASAREYFQRELERPEPRLQDRWFPYLLAFGLGEHIDRWFSAFGGRDRDGGAGAVLGGAVATGGVPGGWGGGSHGGGWTGGGPQFGGGQFGGGGAGGAWGVAAAGMAAGVAAPGSTGGGGGGVAISGGGGGGGW